MKLAEAPPVLVSRAAWLILSARAAGGTEAEIAGAAHATELEPGREIVRCWPTFI
jgi:hypothetical protein